MDDFPFLDVNNSERLLGALQIYAYEKYVLFNAKRNSDLPETKVPVFLFYGDFCKMLHITNPNEKMIVRRAIYDNKELLQNSVDFGDSYINEEGES